jgi:hypothetical protein
MMSLLKLQPQPTSARQARPSLQELPESGARAEIRVFDKPKPKGRKTGISKAMDLLRHVLAR